MNKVILKGRLTADPELKRAAGNTAYTKITVAVDKYSKDGEKAADFISCTAWRQTAEFIGRYFTKGKEILIEGQLHNNNYESNGVKHYSFDVTVDRVEFCGSKNDTGSGVKPSDFPASKDDIGDLSEFEMISDGDVPF